MEEHKKVALVVPMSRQGKLADSSLSDLKHDQKHFIRIPSLNFPEMRPSETLFSQFDQTVTMETMAVRKIETLVLAMYFQVL